MELEVDGDEDGVPAFLDPDDGDADVLAPVETPDGAVLVGSSCSIFSENGPKDPLFFIAMLTAVAGLVRRRRH